MNRAVLLIVAALSLLSAALADQWVGGYFRKDGRYVQGHWRSDPDGKYWNNWSSSGNSNPYTGERGYDLPKLDDYLKRPSYYNYTYRPYGYTPPRHETRAYQPYVSPAYGSCYRSPSTPSLYESPYNRTYRSSTEDYSRPYESEYTPSSSDEHGTIFDLDGDE